jgi:HlyD family secretion protein
MISSLLFWFRRRAFTLGVLLLLPVGAAAAEGTVGAIGRIQPARDVVPLYGPGGDQITEVAVKEGDQVLAGAVLVRFLGEGSAQAELTAARLALREAEEGGANTVELALLAKQAAQQGLAAAKARLARYLTLEPTSISPQETELRRSTVDTAEIEVSSAERKWKQAALSYELMVGKAKNQLVLAEQKLSRAVVRAPFAGTVLTVNAVLGAPAGGVLVQLADLREMVVWAEVFEGDLLKIKIGSRVKLTSASLPSELAGTVESIGRQISGQAKAARVRVKLDQAEPADRFIGMEVNVAIQR